MTTLTYSVEVVPGQVQRPITDFKGARDDFMVYEVNSPELVKCSLITASVYLNLTTSSNIFYWQGEK